DDKNILVDCGLFQGLKQNRLRNWEPFPFPADKIEELFLTHAHIDHTGYLPRLYQEGFRGAVHCTYATRDLCEILLKDSAHLQEEDARWANKKGFSKHKPALPLYTSADAEAALTLFSPLYYGEHYSIGGNIRVKLKDAGHLLGSSFVDVKRTANGNSRKIFFCGDFGRPERPLTSDPVQAFNVDYLVLESTYGNRLHGHDSAEEELARVIRESADRGGVLIIPAFSVGRTQTLLYLIRELEAQGKIRGIPVYLDSPMSIRTTKVFESHIADLDLTARVKILEGVKLFHPGKLDFCNTPQESKALNQITGKAIIISANGMVTGGRILHHIIHRLPHPQNTILFIGYQAEGTRGRQVLDGAETVKIHGQKVPVKARIENISGFSGHPDSNEILAWLMGFNRAPELTFIVHGEPESSSALAQRIRDKLGWKVVVPEFGQDFDLDL
ncbi:MAG: MBL fold metallo-hydrolase, partial [Candidatus Glassbacteria bacterium]|nr:MBL fold metallo-hydrolase [Candidatus Glassbacteria bacterium]